MYFKEDPVPEQSQPLQHSRVAFTKNGKWQGVAYKYAFPFKTYELIGQLRDLML